MKLPSYQELSKEQDKIYNLPPDKSFLVTGPPGTGKTVMALYRAHMYRDRGRRCRILMYSRFLSQYVDSAIDELELQSQVTTYHSWTWKFYRSQYHHPPPQIKKFVNDWKKIANRVLSNPPSTGVQPYVIIDEGQDLPAGFYMVIPHLSREVTIFADENQRISDRQSTLGDIRTQSQIQNELTLTKNYRNTREIAEVARAFYTGPDDELPELPDREGRPPVVERTDGLDEFVEFVINFESVYSDLDLGIFTQTRDLQRRIQQKLKGNTKNPVQYYRREKGRKPPKVNFDKPGIRLVTFASAKGLEFDAVFIPEVQQVNLDPQDPSTKMKLYVLISRARKELFVCYSGSERPPLLDLFPEGLMEWRE